MRAAAPARPMKRSNGTFGPQSVDRQVKFPSRCGGSGIPPRPEIDNFFWVSGVHAQESLFAVCQPMGTHSPKACYRSGKFEFPVKKWTKTLCAPIMHPERFLASARLGYFAKS